MKKTIILLILTFSLTAFILDSFKNEQKKYPRVRQAYEEKDSIVNDLLSKNSIEIQNLNIYLRVFKTEQKVELWAKNKADISYKMIREYEICETSGEIGPKRKQGDLQMPEGFYHINRFNPHSNFYLSLKLNYPNKSDKILGIKRNLGGNVFIHGGCFTIGCIPLTDNKIKELYVFCVEAKNNGQNKIPVTIFPAELSDTKYTELEEKYESDSDKINLWTDLKSEYDIFKESKQLPDITFLSNGRHEINPGLPMLN